MRHIGRRVPGLVAATLVAGALAAVPPATATGATASPPQQGVVVTGPGAAAAVRAAGGTVTDELPLLHAVAATLPAGARLPAGLRVAADRTLRVAGHDSGDESGTTYADAPSTVRATLGLPADAAGGVDGSGVTVALVDTGVADVPDLAGRVLAHVDATRPRPREQRRGDDGFGHGTFLAGLVAASGAAGGGAHPGVAPGADLLDVKVADDSGSTSLVRVLRGLQVVSDQAAARHVRVLSLALASGSPVPSAEDPLALALEALWLQGIVVVVPAGNDGPAAGSMASPGSDPLLLSVGALDEGGTALRADDTVASWSGRGPALEGTPGPALAVPGAHLVGLRAPGSLVDEQNPQARVGDGYFRGSGTSMSTAVAAGAVADLLSASPELGPDQVASVLLGTAYAAAGLTDPATAGAGGLDLAAALAVAATGTPGSDASTTAEDTAAWAALTAALAADDLTAAGRAWAALSPAARAWAGRAWAALSPQGRAWAGRAWAGRAWAGSAWLGRAWAGRAWAGQDWAGRAWAGRAWAGRAWAGRAWAAADVTGGDWAGRAWAGRAWAGRAWSARLWG